MPLKKRKKRVTKKKVIAKKKRIIKRRVTKKKVTRRPKKKAVVAPKPKGKIIGRVTHYFPKVRAGVIKLKVPLSVGDVVKIKGYTTDFTQNVSSIQIDHVPINSAKKGQEVGLLVDSRVRQHDVVYKA